MKNWHWIGIGALAGIASGAIFGFDYAIVGLGLGIVAGAGIMLGMR